MNSDAFKHAVEVIEGHFGKKFGSAETRGKLLNIAFKEVSGCSDSALMRASDTILMRKSFLPSPDEFVSEIKKEAISDAKKADDEQARKVPRPYEKREPLDPVIKKMLHGLTSGKVSRKEWIQMLQKLSRDFPESKINPNDYINHIKAVGKIRYIDMNAPVGSGGGFEGILCGEDE